MTQEGFLLQLVQSLEAVKIPFMVAGSHGSSFYGQPRATNDIDLVVDPSPEQLEQFLNLLGTQYYVSPETAREALKRRSMFNIIDFSNGWKADIIFRKDRPFSIEEFKRRKIKNLGGGDVPLASSEDIILSKLEWDKITPSERQIQDVFHVAVVQGPQLDIAYLRHWASALGVAEKLEEVLAKAKELPKEKNS